MTQRHRMQWRIFAWTLSSLVACACWLQPAFGEAIWNASQILTPGSLTSSDHFGTSVALDRQTAVVTSSRTDDEGGRGYAYIYRETPAHTWSEVAKLSPVGDPLPEFGKSAGISNGNVTIGGPAGAAYIFSDDGSGNWTQTSKLVPDSIPQFCRFGAAVDISGETAIVGDPNAIANGSSSGAAYIFRKNQLGDWLQVAKLFNSDVPTASDFGDSVAIFGNTAIVGATVSGGPGVAYIFREDSTHDWHQIAKLTGGNGPVGYFGQSVDIDGGTVIVGSYQNGQRAAYIFNEESDRSWHETFRFVAAGSLFEDWDKMVAIDGHTAILGAPLDEQSSVYVFRNENGAWDQTDQLKPGGSTKTGFYAFGSAVALSSGVALVGNAYSLLAAPDGGAAYVFDATPEPCAATSILIAIIIAATVGWRLLARLAFR